MVIGTGYTDSCKSNYHTIIATTAPDFNEVPVLSNMFINNFANIHCISGLEDLYIGLPRCELYRTARFELVNVYAYVYKILFTPSMWDRLWIFLRYPNGIANKGTKVLKEAVSRF